MGLLDGKTALITGGSRGIGKCIATHFAQEGADVVFTALHDSKEAADTVSELKAFGHRVMFLQSDSSDFKAAHEVVDKVMAEFGRIDILVNNAGIVKDALILRMTEEDWDSVINVNLKSAFNYIHAVIPVMSRQRKGSIINISSIVGVSGNAGQANYAASKAGMIGLSKSVAKEMGSRGIRSNCIAPGLINSEMTDKMPEDIKQFWLKSISMHRGGTTDEVAGVALFLASDLSTYVSGQEINCCGALNC